MRCKKVCAEAKTLTNVTKQRDFTSSKLREKIKTMKQARFTVARFSGNMTHHLCTSSNIFKHLPKLVIKQIYAV